MLASGFCFNAGRLLEAAAAGGLVSARRNSSGGGESFVGGGESREGGGESRVGSGAACGLLRGGLSTLLIAGAGLDEVAGTLGCELLGAGIPGCDGLAAGMPGREGVTGRANRASISRVSSVSRLPGCDGTRNGAESRRVSAEGGRVEMRGPPSSAFKRCTC